MAQTQYAVLNEESPRLVSNARESLLKKEKRLYNRVDINEKVKYGYDKPVHYGISRDITPDGMSIMTDKVLVPRSNILVNIYVVMKDNNKDEEIKVIEVSGEVIWVKDLSEGLCTAGIKFKQTNEELVRFYAAKLREKVNAL